MDEEREIERLERESERVGEHIEQARREAAREDEDPGAPGVVGDVAGMDGEDSPQTDYPAKG